MTRTATSIVALAVLVLGAPLISAPVPAAAATLAGEQVRDDPQPVQIEQVSPWVGANGTFSLTLRFSEPPPPGSELTWTVGQRLRPDEESLRSATEEFLAGGVEADTLQPPTTVGLDALEPVDAGGDISTAVLRRLSFDIRSGSGDSEAILVPTAGIHPVSLEIAVDSTPLWRSTAFLNRLPVEPPQASDGSVASTAVQLLVGLDSGPTLGLDGAAEIPTDELPSVSSIQSLLSESLEVPLTVALRPNTLLALQRSNRLADEQFVASLTTTNWSFAPQTYVRVDAAGLVESGGSEFRHQLAAGRAINDALSGRTPTPVWMLDDTIDAGAASQLGDGVASHLVISAERLAVTQGDEQLDDDETRTLLRSTSVRLDDAEGMSVSSYDAELTQLLVESDIEPALRAHRVVTELMSEWFAASTGYDDATGFAPLTSALLLTPGVGSEVVAELSAMLEGDGPLRIAAPPPARQDDEAPSARLMPLEPLSTAAMVTDTQRNRDRIQGWRSIAGPTDSLAGELDLVNDQAPWRFADDSMRSEILRGVEATLESKVSQIGLPADRTVVLTSRSRSIPLRFDNDTGGPVRLAMRARSPRLEFPDGPVTEVVLGPGSNRVDLPVEVRAPGSSVLRLELSSPDERLDVPDASVTVRSSSISGVGAALSVISVLVLAVWWIRTHRARRRSDDESPANPDPTDQPASRVASEATLSSEQPGDGGTGE